MEEITPQERSALREYFRANAVPTQEQFWEFIESTLNNVEDGITKTRGTALRIRPATTPGSQVLELFKTQTGTSLAWTLEVVPQLVGTDRPGLHFYQPGKIGTLYLRESDGAVGMGTLNPGARLHVISTTEDKWKHEDIYNSITLSLGGEQEGRPGSLKIQGSAMNDFALVRQASGGLMLDSTHGEFFFNRDNSVRQGPLGAKPDTILHIMNGELEEKIRLHAGGNSFFQGGRVGIGVTEPQAPVHIDGGGEARWEERGSGALLIGNADGVHLAVDTDAILAKANGNTQGTLRLQPGGGHLQVGGSVHILDSLELDKDLTLNEDLIVKAELDVQGASRLHATNITGGLDVSGLSQLHDTKVSGRLDVFGDAEALNTKVNGTFTATGASSLGATTVQGNLAVVGQSDLHATKVDGILDVMGQSFLQAAKVNGTFEVIGDSALRGVEVDGDLNVLGHSTLQSTTVETVLDVMGQSNLSDTQVDGRLEVLGQSDLHATKVVGPLEVTGQSDLHATKVDGLLNVTGQSNLQGATVAGNLGVVGLSTLQTTQVHGTLEVTDVSNLRGTDINGELHVNGQSHLQAVTITGYLQATGNTHLLNTHIGGGLHVGGYSSLEGAQVIGSLVVHDELTVNGIAHLSTLNAAQIVANSHLETVNLHVHNQSTLGNANTGDLNVHGQFFAHGPAQMQQLNAQDITLTGMLQSDDITSRLLHIQGQAELGSANVNGALQSQSASTDHLMVFQHASLNNVQISGTVNGHDIITNYLTVHDQVNLGATNINGALNVMGGMNLNSLNIQGFLQANSAEVSNLQVLGQSIISDLHVGSLTQVQNAQINQLNATIATVHDLHVTGILNYPGMNVNGPGNFALLNIDGSLTFMQGAFRIDAAAGEMRIGSQTNPDTLKIMQDGQLRINMDQGGGYPGYPGSYGYGSSDLMLRGRMDIVDGNMEPYDPSMMYPGSVSYKADLVVTGHRSRIAIASDIYSSSEPGSTLEFAAKDGGMSSAFVFSVEQLRETGSSYPYYGNPGMPGGKLGFYLWHRETENDMPFGMYGSNSNDRIPFTIDGARFRVGVGTSNPYTRLDVTGQANMQALQMVVMEAEPGQLENEYSGNFNNYPGYGTLGGAAIGFGSEITNGLPAYGYGPQPEGYVPGLFGKIGLSRNPNGPPPGVPPYPGMPESSGMELNTYYELPIRMRISDQTMMTVQRELQHARVEIGKEGAEPSRLIVHGDLEVKGTLIGAGPGGGGPRPYGEFMVPSTGPGQEFVPIWYKDHSPDGSLLEVEFFTGDPGFPTIFQMRSFHFDNLPGGSSAGILQVQTLHNGTALGVADATLGPDGYRVIWVRSGHTYRWRANNPIAMYNEVAPPPMPLNPLSQPVPELMPGPMPGQQGYLFRQI